jgi:site-specific recombinase XerC
MARLTVVKPKSSPLETLVSDYLAHQRGRGLSPRTVALTENILTRTLLPWCIEHEVTGADKLDQRAVNRFQADLIGRGLARESVRTYCRTCNTFARWAQQEGELSAKVTFQQPRRQKRVREVLSREEIQRLEDAAVTERDKVIIRVLADCGIRLGELLGLEADDLIEQGRERYIKVDGKTGQHLVPVPPALYMRLRRLARGREGSRLFATIRRSPKTGELEPLAARSVQNMIRFVGERAGLKRQLHPHLLRHSYITHGLRKGINLVALQKIVGWSSLAMFKDYEHLVVSDSYAAMLELLRAD